MSRMRHKPDEIVSKLRQVDVLVAQGTSVADGICTIGVTEVGSETSWLWAADPSDSPNPARPLCRECGARLVGHRGKPARRGRTRASRTGRLCVSSRRAESGSINDRRSLACRGAELQGSLLSGLPRWSGAEAVKSGTRNRG